MSCYDYGSSNGCDLGCPHLWAGTCDVVEEVIEQYESELSDDELHDLNIIYDLEEEAEFKSIW